MKQILLFFFLIISSISIKAQTTILDTITVDGLERYYRLYLPVNYSEDANMPLVMNFHGYGSDAIQQELYTGLFLLANTENFVVCHPEGTLDQIGKKFFNVGFPNSTGVDDVNFATTLIDLLIEDYKLDSTRVYSCGMSNGGYFSYKLACERGDKIAAVCSVTGSMVPAQFEACMPAPIPVMQMHGTADPTVLYEGDEIGVPIETLVDYWVNINQCNTEPEYTAIEDVNTDDECTAELFKYTEGINGNEVHFYKIEGGGHSWPSSSIDYGVTNRDFNANQAIWDFFKQYTNVITTTTNETSIAENEMNIYPNPFSDFINIESDFSNLGVKKLYTVSGQLLIETESVNLNTENLPSGLYILNIENEATTESYKLIKH